MNKTERLTQRYTKDEVKKIKKASRIKKVRFTGLIAEAALIHAEKVIHLCSVGQSNKI